MLAEEKDCKAWLFPYLLLPLPLVHQLPDLVPVPREGETIHLG